MQVIAKIYLPYDGLSTKTRESVILSFLLMVYIQGDESHVSLLKHPFYLLSFLEKKRSSTQLIKDSL